MSKNILGQTFGTIDLNLDLVGDINATNLTASTSITGSYLTANKGLATDINKKIVSTTASSDEINFLTGTTSNIQTQLNNKLLGDGIASAFQYAAVVGGSQNILSMNFQAPANDDITHTSSAKQIKDALDTKEPTISLTANRALVSNGSGGLAVSDITNTELDFLDGISSNIQTQLTTNASAITSANSAIATNATAIATNATAIAGKEPTVSLTANRALISNGSGGLAVSDITNTELDFLDGVSSNIQSQLTTNATAIAGKQATIGNSLSTTNTFTLVVGSLSPKTFTFNATGDFVGAGSITDATGNVLSGKQNIFNAGSNLTFDTSTTPATLNATDTDTNPWTINGNIISYTAGQVGIGDAGASDKALSVRKDGLTKVLQYWVSNLGTTGDRPLLLRSPDADSADSPFEFQTGNALSFIIDSIEALCINSGGKIGMGTNTPSGLFTTTINDAGTGDGRESQGGALMIANATPGATNTQNIVMGVNTTNEFAYIQSIKTNVAFKNLILNPRGGNVGIGTDDPDNTLTLDGVFQLNPQSGSAKFAMYSDNDKFEINKRSSSGGFEANMFVMNTSGDVGIGSTSPSAKLHVASSTATNVKIESTGGSTKSSLILKGRQGDPLSNPHGMIEFQNINTADDYTASQIVVGGSSNAARDGVISFKNNLDGAAAPTSLSSVMILYRDRVGIGSLDGTTAPESALHVRGAIDPTPSLSGVHIGSETSAPSIFRDAIINLVGSSSNDAEGTINFWKPNTFGGRIRYFHNGHSMEFTTNGVEQMRIKNDKVGIGTNSPSEKLDVNGTALTAYVSISNHSTLGMIGSRNFNSYSSNTYALLLNGTTTYLNGYGTSGTPLRFRTNGSDRMYLSYDGKFGVGTSNPSELLHVNGVCRATSFTTTSDDRVKHFEKPTTDCLTKIMSLKPTTYQKSNELYDIDFVLSEDKSNLKEGDELHLEVGFIAQEVKESIYEEFSSSVKGGDFMGDPVVNEPVVEEETVVEEESLENTEEPVVEEEPAEKVLIEQEYTLNYNNIFVVAVGAIQELKLEIDTLKERIALLESK